MKNLYIDFDGVIMNTIEISYNELKKLGLDDKNPDHQQEINNFFANIDWVELMKKSSVINDAIICIKKILDSKKFEVSILTHVVTISEAEAKIEFVRRYLNDITIIPVPRSLSKTQMVHTKDAILIDDYVENLKEWKNEGGIGIKFSTKLNGRGFPVIDRLDQILEIL